MESVKKELDRLYRDLYKYAVRDIVLAREAKLYELHRQINAVERYLAYLQANCVETPQA